jgi:hypothetical protein
MNKIKKYKWYIGALLVVLLLVLGVGFKTAKVETTKCEYTAIDAYKATPETVKKAMKLSKKK